MVVANFCSIEKPGSSLMSAPCCGMLLSVVGISAMLFLMKILWENSGSLPFKVRCLVINISIDYIVRNAYFAYKSTYHLLILIFGFQAMSMSYSACIIEQLVFICPAFCRYFSFLLISIDRLSTTTQRPTALRHSSDNRYTILSLILFLVVWVPAFALYTLITITSYPSLKINDGIMCYCFVTLIWHPTISTIYSIFLILMQLVTTCIYAVVYKKNKNILQKFVITTTNCNLNDRFVQWANVKTSKWLMPLTLYSVVLSVATLSISTAIGSIFKLTFVDVSEMAMISTFILSLEACLFPFLCISFSPMLLQVVQQQHPKTCKAFHMFSSRTCSTGIFQMVPANTSLLTTNTMNASSLAPMVPISRIDPTSVTSNIIKLTDGLTDGKRKILDFRIDPETQADIVEKEWRGNQNFDQTQ